MSTTGTTKLDAAATNDDAAYADIEEMAVQLAQLAGAAIATSLSRTLSITYKTAGVSGGPPGDPVSETDRAIEATIRTRLAEKFSSDGIIGEELEEAPAASCARVWVIDPIDGTLNFINGFPLFAASIGVLEHGIPVVGAVWCSTSHELRPGVYHARRGGSLCFENRVMRPGVPNPDLVRRLEGVPGGRVERGERGDARVTGSAALECAFVATGLLVAARFRRPHLWDVAGGVMLVQAAGGRVSTWNGHDWTTLQRFTPTRRRRSMNLRDWRLPMLLEAPSPDPDDLGELESS